MNPAYIDKEAQQSFWNERSGYGFPIGASEMQDKIKEKKGWVQNKPSDPSCMYSAQGEIVCPNAKTSPSAMGG